MCDRALLLRAMVCYAFSGLVVEGLAVEPPDTSSSPSPASGWKENARSNATRSEPRPSATPVTTNATPQSDLAANSSFSIALDIGHTPKKGGAVSARGISEYDFNRRLVNELFQRLQHSRVARSFIVNPDRNEISLAKRADAAEKGKADLFLAIHHDSVKESYLKKWEFDGKTRKYCDDFHGYSIFISQKNAKPLESLGFATALGRALLKAGFTPTLHHVVQENRPLIDKEKGIYAFDDLIVLKAAKMPAALLECGVIVNREEETNLNDLTYRNRLIGAINEAVESLAAAPQNVSEKK